MSGLLLSVLVSAIVASDWLNGSVLSIAQDGDGNMWFSTENRLVRYDGYDLQPFESPTRNASLMTDSEGRIWAVKNAAGVFDRDSSSFYVIPGLSIHYFWDMEQISDDLLLLATDDGIRAVNPLTRSVCEVPDFLADVRAVEFYVDGDSLYVCTTGGEIFLYSLSGREFLSSFSLGWHGPVNDMLVLSGQTAVVATEGYGIFILYLNSGEVRHLSGKSAGTRKLESDYVRVLSAAEDGRILAGTGNGLSVISIQGDVINTLSAGNDGSLLKSSIKSICRDSDGGLWVGSYMGGVNYFSGYSHFRTTRLDTPETGNIGCLAADQDGSLWLGLSCSGIARFDVAENRVVSAVYESPELIADDVTSISTFRDGRRMLVATSLGGLKIFDKVTGRFENLKIKGLPQSAHALCPEDERYVWVGTMGGLFLVDIDTRSVTDAAMSSSRDCSPVYHIFKDRTGRLWIGTGDKIFLIRKKAGTDGRPAVESIRNLGRLPGVNDIMESDSLIWVSTNNGLYSFNMDGENTGIFRDGFSSEFLYGLQMDSAGRIWISSSNGMNCFYPETGVNRTFCPEDGLPDSFFKNSAHCTASDGNIYFGSSDGIVCLNPDSEWQSRPSHTPVISSVSINGNRIMPPLEEKLSLKYFQNTLNFTFSVPNFSSWGHDRFYYRLKGAGDFWQPAGKERSVTFSNLRPGKYELDVKSVNCDGVESVSVKSLSFVIKRPWYSSAAAILLYTIFLALLVFLALQYAIGRINARHREELAIASRLGMEESNMMKVEKYAVSPLSQEDFRFLFKVIETISNNISDEEFSVDNLASSMCMSRSNLHLKIKKLTGRSAIKLIWSMRFQKASELLKRTEMPVSEIAAAVGFSSPSYFAACFKKETGVSPATFRK